MKLSKPIKEVLNYRNPTDWILKRILTRSGPVAAALNADLMYNYKGGILDCSSLTSSQTNHAILVVGYDKDSWIIKNSWGTDWG